MKKELEGNALLAALQSHRGGAILGEGSAALQELVAAVAMTGKAGTLTIQIKVSPATRGHSAVVLGDKITLKAPAMQAEESFWYATEGGELRKNDPRQREMSLAIVESGPATQPTPAQAAAAAL